MPYEECTITIGRPGEPLEVEYSAPYPIKGRLQLDDLTRVTIERLDNLIRTDEKRGTGDILSLLGLYLYEVLFGDEKIKEAFAITLKAFEKKYRENNKLRLRVKLVFHTGAAELARFPWEFTYVPMPDIKGGFFLAGNKTELILTRFVPEMPSTRDLVPEEHAVKILIVSCQPDGLRKVQEEEEVDELNQTLGYLVKKGRVEVTVLKDPTYQKLAAAVKGVHVLHFIGHGEEGKLALIRDPDDPDYDILRGGKQVKWIDSQQIRQLFANPPRPRLIFLNACKGAAATSLESFRSTALGLVYQEIPAVVAMQYDISNVDARAFTMKFYEQIGEGKDIDEAVKAGRITLGERSAWNDRRFGAPVVYLQSEKAVVIEPQPPPGGGIAQVKCPRCGNPWPAGQLYCGSCGMPLKAEVAAVTVAARPAAVPVARAAEAEEASSGFFRG